MKFNSNPWPGAGEGNCITFAVDITRTIKPGLVMICETLFYNSTVVGVKRNLPTSFRGGGE